MRKRNKKTGGRYIDVPLVYSRMKRFIFLSTLFLIIAEGCCNHSSCRVPSELKDSLVVDYMSMIGRFYDSSLVDWDAFVALDINQNKSDWGTDIEKVIHPSWRGHEAASIYWERLSSARTYLHYKSVPLRTACGTHEIGHLDAFEEAFDEAFVEMVSQEYYLRVFQDVFDEIFPSRIDDLAVALSQNNRNFVTDSIYEGIYCKRAREYEQY